MTDATESSRPKDYKYSLKKVRSHSPAIHCIVNEAAAALTANVLLAVGASPSLTYSPNEINYFVDQADALSINLGMLTNYKFRAAQQAVVNASVKKMPWVLDPTMIDRSETRLKNCLSLIDTYPPAVIRGNLGEMTILYQRFNSEAGELSTRFDTIFVISGETDLVISPDQTIQIDTGHEWMRLVTGLGCALSALIAAFLAVHERTAEATAEVLQIYGNAGKLAAKHSHGPGTFASYLIDYLHDESEDIF